MLNSELLRKAHKMTKEIKEQYPEVNYKFQYGLCLSYLLKIGEEAKVVREFNFERNGLEFKFKNPRLNKYNKLVLDWKVIGSDDSENNTHSADGYFKNAELDTEVKAIRCNFKLNKKKMAGAKPQEDIFNELYSIFEDLKEKRAELFEKTVVEVAEGKRNINFSIVGCDYPYYQPYLHDCDEDLKGQEQSIVSEAIKRLTGEKFVSNSCEYIERKLKQAIRPKEDINPKAFNLRFDKEVQEYHNFKETIVTGFEMKLTDAIKLDELLERKANEEARRKAIFDKARETGEKQELSHWTEPCNDPNEECDIDWVYIYAMPDGTTKKVRHHTW